MIVFDYGLIRFLELLRYRLVGNITRNQIEDSFFSDNTFFHELGNTTFLINFNGAKFLMADGRPVEYTETGNTIHVIDAYRPSNEAIQKYDDFGA